MSDNIKFVCLSGHPDHHAGADVNELRGHPDTAGAIVRQLRALARTELGLPGENLEKGSLKLGLGGVIDFHGFGGGSGDVPWGITARSPEPRAPASGVVNLQAPRRKDVAGMSQKSLRIKLHSQVGIRAGWVAAPVARAHAT